MPKRSPQELLELVRRKAEAIQRRRAWAGAGTVVAVLVALPLLATTLRDAPETSLSAVGPPTTTTFAEESTTTSSGSATRPPGADATTTTTSQTRSSSTTSSGLGEDTNSGPVPTTGIDPAPSTTPGLPPTTAAATPCRNSSEPACGPFYWEPPPEPNLPLTVQVTSSPAEPRAGETVTFHVVAEDPDATIDKEHNQQREWGDGTSDPSSSTHGDCAPLHGPWTPPTRTRSRHEATFEHVYSEPGTYTARFSFQSSSFCVGVDPYGSEGEGTVIVMVRS